MMPHAGHCEMSHSGLARGLHIQCLEAGNKQRREEPKMSLNQRKRLFVAAKGLERQLQDGKVDNTALLGQLDILHYELESARRALMPSERVSARRIGACA